MESLEEFVAAYVEGIRAQAEALQKKLNVGEAPEAEETVEFLLASLLRLCDVVVVLARNGGQAAGASED